jgi:nucleoid-associated protein YgaU
MAAMDDVTGQGESEAAPIAGGPEQPATPPGDGRGDAPQDEVADAATPDAAEGEEPPSGPPQRPPAPPAEPAYAPYVVKEGDTLSSIAQSWFGDAARWDLIQEANPAIDPNRLRIGQVLRLPGRGAVRDPASETDGGGGTYTVRTGDTLSSIARILLGEERHWRLLYEANRSAIGPNPDAIAVGMRLVIPSRP